MKAKRGTYLYEYQKNNKSGVCGKCGRETKHLTVDHIIPQYFIEKIGLRNESVDHDWNFQLLCFACNQLKNNSFDFTDKRTIPNFRRYIDLAEQHYSA